MEPRLKTISDDAIITTTTMMLMMMMMMMTMALMTTASLRFHIYTVSQKRHRFSTL